MRNSVQRDFWELQMTKKISQNQVTRGDRTDDTVCWSVEQGASRQDVYVIIVLLSVLFWHAIYSLSQLTPHGQFMQAITSWSSAALLLSKLPPTLHGSGSWQPCVCKQLLLHTTCNIFLCSFLNFLAMDSSMLNYAVFLLLLSFTPSYRWGNLHKFWKCFQ